MKNKGTIGVGLCISVGLAACVTWLLWPSHSARVYPAARTRTTIDVTVCLLTGPGGATSNSATATDAAAWKGILAAQVSTNLRAQSYPVTGTETSQNAQTSINTLALRGCELIITTGSAENAAATTQAHLFPHVEFAPQTSANATAITADTKAKALALVKDSH
jgi:hypothetical protein